MKKRLLWLVAIPLIAIGSLTYADNDFIVHDTASWTITVYSQDKSYWITIQDKNLWATEIYTWVDNKNTYGYYFQWWNNHGNSWDSSTVSTLLSTDGLSDWANNWYSGDVTQFIQKSNSYGDYWSGLTNYNETGAIQHSLWWGSWDNDNIEGIVKWYDTVNHVATNMTWRQWPCPEWYHVPSAWEWQELMKLWCNANPDICSWTVIQKSDWCQNNECEWANYLGSNGGIWTAFSDDLQLPFAGYRNYYVGNVSGQGFNAFYWSSSPRGGSTPKHAWSLYFDSSYVSPSSYDSRANGQSVRCFKNSYVKPPKTLNLFFMTGVDATEEIWSGTVTENMTGAVPEEAKNVTKTGYILEYRYLSGADATTGFDFENEAITWWMADESGNVYFIAQWTGIKYEIKFEAWDWTWTMENQTFTYGVTWTLSPNAFIRDWYTFSGWTDWTNVYTDWQEVSNLTTTGGDVITLTAEWTKNKTSGGSSWWGWSMKKDNCPNGDFSPSYYDWTCTADNSTGDVIQSETQWSEESSNDNDTPMDSHVADAPQNDEGKSQWLTESENAYNFAFKNWITTMNTIDKANLDWYIKRWHLAKMVVNYVVNVLWRDIPSDIPAECLSWTDTYRESDEIKDYATKSCALWLMWIEVNQNFDPEKIVPRSQFGAVLSRILRWDKYNIEWTADKPRYTDHLNALKNEWIMTQIDNPKILEKRWYIMIMLMRSAK